VLLLSRREIEELLEVDALAGAMSDVSAGRLGAQPRRRAGAGAGRVERPA
jgi:hypothetical protein